MNKWKRKLIYCLQIIYQTRFFPQNQITFCTNNCKKIVNIVTKNTVSLDILSFFKPMEFST